LAKDVFTVDTLYIEEKRASAFHRAINIPETCELAYTT